jgi:hypothetical protein
MMRTMPQRLFLELELLYDGGIALCALLLEIIQMRLAIGDHAEEAAARVVVFFVLFQMAGQFIDALAQNGDLDLGRTRVLVMDGGLLDYLCLFLH